MSYTVQELAVHGDARGMVFEPLASALMASQRNVHVVVTVPGGVRGNHFHRQGTERIAVTGPALVRVRENGKTADLTVPPDRVHLFTFPPGVAHAIQNTGAKPNILVAFNTEPHRPDAPDVVAEPLIPA